MKGGNLSEVPSRGNYAVDCTLTNDPDLPSHLAELPDHLNGCECDNHHAVCDSCGFKVTVGPDGTEYGHARNVNRGGYSYGPGDCEYREGEKVNPDRSKPQVHGGKAGGTG